MEMGLKGFFKITRFKIILFFILLIITIFIPQIDQHCISTIDDVVCQDVLVWGSGFPMFYGTNYCGDAIEIRFFPIMFVVNLIVYYLLSCVIILTYNNWKASKKQTANDQQKR